MTASVDHDAIARMPVGYRHTVLCAALLKRALALPKVTTGERLRWLEQINALTDATFTPERLAAVQPMGDVEYAMLAEAMTLDGDRVDGRCSASFNMLTRDDVFSNMVGLNPSLLTGWTQ